MSRKGQATTELALGLLVFVTVLLFGIHFAEVGYAMMKTKEAAAYAAARASGERTHTFALPNVTQGTTYAPFSPASAGAATQAKYGTGWKGVLTQVQGSAVSCRVDDTIRFSVQSPGGLAPTSTAAVNYLRTVYRDRGGASCTASGRVSLFRISSSFAEGGNGFFKEKHVQLTDYTVCGAGMPSNGQCKGKLAFLTGDWGYEGPTGSKLNDDNPDVRNLAINNPSYKQVVETLFDLAGGPYSNPADDVTSVSTPAQQLMIVGGRVDPNAPEWINETRFAMSYRGEETGPQVRVRRHSVFPAYNDKLEYQTSGADLGNSLVGWNEKDGLITGVPRCFLGMYGCERDPAKSSN